MDPMNLGQCPKCSTQLMRETTTGPYSLLCANYEPDIEGLRRACLEKGVPEQIVKTIFPPQKEPDATPVQEGAPADAPASDEAGAGGR